MDHGFEDWSIAASGGDLPVIGWAYHELVTGEATRPRPLDEIPDNEFDQLADCENGGADEQQGMDLDMESEVNMEVPTEESTSSSKIFESSIDVITDIDPSGDGHDDDNNNVNVTDDMWAAIFLQTPGRSPREISRLRKMSGAPTFAPACDYNATMALAWNRLWLGMKENEPAESLLRKYNEYWEDRRLRSRDSSSPPDPLLPVSSTEVKEFIRRKSTDRSLPVHQGCIDEQSQAIVGGILGRLGVGDESIWGERQDAPVLTVDQVIDLPPSREDPPPIPTVDEVSSPPKKRPKTEKIRTALDKIPDERREKAMAALALVGLEPVMRKKGDPQLCSTCQQYRSQTNILANGERHHVINRGAGAMGGGKLWCPFADSLEELEAAMRERKKRSAERYHRYNSKRKNKKEDNKVVMIDC
ncbi:hypothetical protein FOL46_008015 [Perkinsus olseni]|nr:hypothetical protein FOL46_008015 [Perkinsus olseni]